MKTTILTLFAILTVATPAWSQESKRDDLPKGCKALIADTRACIPKNTSPEAIERINRVLDMMTDNIRNADPSERQEVCQATITSYRQMADLVCAPVQN
jgi:hypothetical protein